MCSVEFDEITLTTTVCSVALPFSTFFFWASQSLELMSWVCPDGHKGKRSKLVVAHFFYRETHENNLEQLGWRSTCQFLGSVQFQSIEMMNWHWTTCKSYSAFSLISSFLYGSDMRYFRDRKESLLGSLEFLKTNLQNMLKQVKT